MNDYNRGALSEPCMRLPYGFGGDWASIELGDGTGYVKLSEYEKVASNNAKLRELVRDWYELAVGGADSLTDWNHAQADLEQRMRELGIEVDG